MTIKDVKHLVSTLGDCVTYKVPVDVHDVPTHPIDILSDLPFTWLFVNRKFC